MARDGNEDRSSGTGPGRAGPRNRPRAGSGGVTPDRDIRPGRTDGSRTITGDWNDLQSDPPEDDED